MIISEPQTQQNGRRVRAYTTENLTDIEFIQAVQRHFASLGKESLALENLQEESKKELLEIIEAVTKISNDDINFVANNIIQFYTDIRSRIVNVFAANLAVAPEKFVVYIPEVEPVVLENPELKKEINEALNPEG